MRRARWVCWTWFAVEGWENGGGWAGRGLLQQCARVERSADIAAVTPPARSTAAQSPCACACACVCVRRENYSYYRIHVESVQKTHSPSPVNTYLRPLTCRRCSKRYGKGEQWRAAEEAYKQMQAAGVTPNVYTPCPFAPAAWASAGTRHTIALHTGPCNSGCTALAASHSRDRRVAYRD